MRRSVSIVIILVLVVIIGLLTFLLGRKSAPASYDNIVNNTTFIKQIAELSTLEAQGTSSIKHTNVQNNGTFSDAMRKMFLENTVNYSVPYVAKYGVDLKGQNVIVKTKDSVVTVYLPMPKLLSYELQLDKMQTSSQRGWLESASDAQFAEIQKKMYAQTRSQLANNQLYIDAAKVKVKEIIGEYYKPLGYKIEVVFGQQSVKGSQVTGQ